MTKDQSEPVCFSVHGPIRTSPKGSGCSPPISGSVLNQLQLQVALFGSQKLDWTRPLNTIHSLCLPICLGMICCR